MLNELLWILVRCYRSICISADVSCRKLALLLQ